MTELKIIPQAFTTSEGIGRSYAVIRIVDSYFIEHIAIFNTWAEAEDFVRFYND